MVAVGAGTTLTLSVTPDETGYTYLWTDPDGVALTDNDGNDISTEATPEIANAVKANEGTYTVAVTHTASGYVSVDTTTVTTYWRPDFTPESNLSDDYPTQDVFNVGDTIMLDVDNPTGTTVAWSGPNSYSSSSENPTGSRSESCSPIGCQGPRNRPPPH